MIKNGIFIYTSLGVTQQKAVQLKKSFGENNCHFSASDCPAYSALILFLWRLNKKRYHLFIYIFALPKMLFVEVTNTYKLRIFAEYARRQGYILFRHPSALFIRASLESCKFYKFIIYI